MFYKDTNSLIDEFPQKFTSIPVPSPIFYAPEAYLTSIKEILLSNNIPKIYQELNQLYKYTQRNDFPFLIQFLDLELPSIFIHTLIASQDKSITLLFLKIIFNLTRDDNYCRAFSIDPELINHLIQLFQLHSTNNKDVISFLLLIMTRFSSFSKDFCKFSFQFLSPFITFYQNSKDSLIRNQILQYFLILTSPSNLSSEDFSLFTTKFELLSDFFNEYTTQLATSILYNLSKHEQFIIYFESSSFRCLLSNNLTSTNPKLLLPTLHIYRKLYEYFQYQEEPDFYKISNCIASKNLEIIYQSSHLFVFLVHKFPQSLKEETACKITRMLIDLIINGENQARFYRIDCLVALFNEHHELISEIANEDVILTVAEFLESDDPDLLKQTIILLNTVFQQEQLIDSERHLFYAFVDNDGLDQIRMLENGDNEEVAQLSTLFLKLE